MESKYFSILNSKKEYIKLKKEIKENLKLFNLKHINEFKLNIDKIKKQFPNKENIIEKLKFDILSLNMKKLLISLNTKNEISEYYVSLLNKPLNEIYQNKFNINEKELLNNCHYIIKKNNSDELFGLIIINNDELLKFNINELIDLEKIEQKIRYFNIR